MMEKKDKSCDEYPNVSRDGKPLSRSKRRSKNDTDIVQNDGNQNNREKNKSNTFSSILQSMNYQYSIKNSAIACASSPPPPPQQQSASSASAASALASSMRPTRRTITSSQSEKIIIQETTSSSSNNTTSNNNNSNSDTPKSLTKNEMLTSLVAGAGSGTASSIACAPLDLIRTRMQVMGELHKTNNKSTSSHTSSRAGAVMTNSNNVSIIRSIRDVYHADGVRGCFRGLGMTLLTVPTFWGLYFPLYEVMKKDLHHLYLQQQQQQQDSNGLNQHDTMTIEEEDVRVPPIVHMASAIFTGAIADFFCNPMFVVRTRMQTEALHHLEHTATTTTSSTTTNPIHFKQRGIGQTVQSLYIEGGRSLSIFWRGFTASLLGLTHVGIQFPVYEFLKAEARLVSPKNEETPFDLLIASALSKMIATTLTYPHEVIRSRMMDYRNVGGGGEGGIDGNSKSSLSKQQQHGLIRTFHRIVANEGYKALYTGIHVSLVRVVPNCCITFMTYEMILRWAKTTVLKSEEEEREELLSEFDV